MFDVSDAATGQPCTTCGRTITDDEPAVYVSGFGFGSRRFELILCAPCADNLASELRAELAHQQEYQS